MISIKRILKKKSHGLRRLIQKAYIGMHRKTAIHPSPKSPYQSECIGIFKKMLSHQGTILIVAPISSRIYMKNESQGIYIVIHGKTMEVINKVYKYMILLDEKSWGKVIEEFNCELEKRGGEFEAEMSKNVKNSLKTILKSIDQNEAE